MVGMLCSLYAQQPTSVSSTVHAVTVYPDRAGISRVGTATLPEGATVLRFTGLPDGLEEDSVVVRAQSDATLTIEGIDIQNQFLAASALPKTKELQSQLQALEDQKKSFSSAKGVLEEKRAFFRNLAAGLDKGEKETVNVDEIKKLYIYYGDELSSVADNILSVERSQAKLEPELDRVKRELEALSSGQQKSQRTVLVSVKAAAPAKAEFTVSYLIGNASWTPSYDARVDSTTGKVELLYNALVRQQTTEDWNDVQSCSLNCSTRTQRKNAMTWNPHSWTSKHRSRRCQWPPPDFQKCLLPCKRRPRPKRTTSQCEAQMPRPPSKQPASLSPTTSSYQ